MLLEFTLENTGERSTPKQCIYVCLSVSQPQFMPECFLPGIHPRRKSLCQKEPCLSCSVSYYHTVGATVDSSSFSDYLDGGTEHFRGVTTGSLTFVKRWYRPARRCPLQKRTVSIRYILYCWSAEILKEFKNDFNILTARKENLQLIVCSFNFLSWNYRKVKTI